ncbi:hypothetical protein EUX98_g525 [Antrodiella citrinella]|uniref:REJ domain-containing protein n=1 Tax=Antrodiella citrinella TaxID=2447956 RepID=A0A4S4N3S4_9APHY|nr:hypothetical protein EUX98_g525 [Antrodiella citrinella]
MLSWTVYLEDYPGGATSTHPSSNDGADALGQLAGQLGIPLDSLTNLLPSSTELSTLTPSTTPTDISSAATSTPASTTPSTTPSSTSSTPSQTSDTASQTSASLVATSASDSQTSAPPTSTPSPTDTATPTPSPSATPPASSDTSSSSSATSSSVSESATPAAAASAPKSFLQNKGLSIPIITLASIAGLVLLIIIATWFIRRRRRNNVENLVAGISTDDLVGATDIEKGSGLTGHGGGMGHDLGFGFNRPLPTAPAGMSGNQMYERPGPSVFPPPSAPPAHVPMYSYAPPSQYRNMQAGQGPKSRSVNPYPAGPHTQAPRGYDNDYPVLTNPFDDPNGVYKAPAAYLPPVDPISPLAGATVTRSGSNRSYRKPAPPMLDVVVSAESSPPSAVSSHSSAQSHDLNPMQLPSPMNPANPPSASRAAPVNPAQVALPPTPQAMQFSPADADLSNYDSKRGSRHNSMLNGPPASPSSEEYYSSSEGSHARSLDPALPQLPVAPPLPDQFGSREQRSPSPNKGKKPRQLKVVNQ